MKKKIIIALTIVLCFSIMVIKKASAQVQIWSDISPNDKDNWQGSKVENQGYCEKVYFNTALPYFDIVNFLKSLTYYPNPLGDGEISPLLVSENGFVIVANKGVSNLSNEIEYSILFVENITAETPIIEEVFWTYWYKNGNGYWDYSSLEIYANLLNNFMNIPVGSNNKNATFFFSSTPFVYLPTKENSTSQEDIDNAYNDGMADGWQAGYDEGYDYGYDDGEHDGYNEGASEGYQDGYEAGYDEGIKKGEEVNANLGDMFLNILDSPRQAISNILNFEFLGINLASLVFFLITAILVVVIIKFFI